MLCEGIDLVPANGARRADVPRDVVVQEPVRIDNIQISYAVARQGDGGGTSYASGAYEKYALALELLNRPVRGKG
jgi:hypothetical protein